MNLSHINHDGFQSQRGCRKHVNTKESWFFYFNKKPNSKEITDSLKVARNVQMVNTIQDQTSETTKHAGKLLPSFSLSCDIGEVFTRWLTGSGGGCKKDRAAQQIVTRCFKFLRFCCEDVFVVGKSLLLTWWTLVCVLQICCSNLSTT